MTELNNIQRVVGWSSTKNADGTFTATVSSFDHGTPRSIHGCYTRASRSAAVNAAKQAIRCLKSAQRAA